VTEATDLGAFPLFAELGEEERAALADALEELVLEPGTVVVEEGESGEGLLLVAEGGIRIGCSRDGEQDELGPGASLGAFSLVSNGPREVCAETTSRTRILVLRRSAFRRLTQREPRAACGLLEALLRETARISRAAVSAVAESSAAT